MPTHSATYQITHCIRYMKYVVQSTGRKYDNVGPYYFDTLEQAQKFLAGIVEYYHGYSCKEGHPVRGAPVITVTVS